MRACWTGNRAPIPRSRSLRRPWGREGGRSPSGPAALQAIPECPAAGRRRLVRPESGAGRSRACPPLWVERQVASLISSRSPAAYAAAGDLRSHLNEAVEDALPRRPILLGAHGGSFLIAHHHFFLGIPVNGPPAQPKRHVAQVAYGRRSMPQLQIAERFVARLDTTDPVALVGVEHLLFQRFAATWGAAARASAGFTLCAPATRAAPAAGSRLSFDPRLRLGVVRSEE